MTDDELYAAIAQILRDKGWQPVWATVTPTASGKAEVSVLPGTTGPAPFGQEGQQPPGATLAFRPPPGVKIFDVDHYADKHGLDTIGEAEKQLGVLPKTWRVSARGGGNLSGRYLYRCPEDVEFNDSVFQPFGSLEERNGRTKVWTDVEVVRTRHRFSWAPGTPHYKTGTLIEVYFGFDDEPCAMPSVGELPELPAAWLAYLANPPRPQGDEQFRPDADKFGVGIDWYGDVPSASIGTRGQLCDFAFWVMASTRNDRAKTIAELKRVAVALDPSDPWQDRDFYGMTDANTRQKTGEWLRQRDSDPYYSAGMEQMVQEGTPTSLAPANPQPTSVIEEQSAAGDPEEEAGSWLNQALASDVTSPAEPVELTAEEKFKKTDLYKTERSRQLANRLAREELEAAYREDEGRKFFESGGFSNPYDADDPEPPSTFHVTGLGHFITPNTVTVIYGNRASGKTWVAATWAQQEVTYGNHVFWLDFERQESLMKTKLKALHVGEHLAGQQFHYAGGVLVPAPFMAERIREFGEDGKRHPLVVIDSFRDLLGAVVPDGDSNSGESVGKVYGLYLNLLIEAGATVCLIDHAPKSNLNTTFGSERKESAADNVLKVEMMEKFVLNHSGYSKIEITKDRYGVWPVDDEGNSRAAYLWVPSKDEVTSGKDDEGVQTYHEIPRLRSWAPRKQGELEDIQGSPRDQDVLKFVNTGMKTLEEIVNEMQRLDSERKKANRVWIRERSRGEHKAGDPMDREGIKGHISQSGDHMLKRGLLVRDAEGNFEVRRDKPTPTMPQFTKQIDEAALLAQMNVEDVDE